LLTNQSGLGKNNHVNVLLFITENVWQFEFVPFCSRAFRSSKKRAIV
jgi:hypothetical protein